MCLRLPVCCLGAMKTRRAWGDQRNRNERGGSGHEAWSPSAKKRQKRQASLSSHPAPSSRVVRCDTTPLLPHPPPCLPHRHHTLVWVSDQGQHCLPHLLHRGKWTPHRHSHVKFPKKKQRDHLVDALHGPSRHAHNPLCTHIRTHAKRASCPMRKPEAMPLRARS